MPTKLLAHQKKILIIDDDKSLLEVTSYVLEDAGFKVETTTKGSSALNLKNNLPDLILLDILLSGESGTEICQFLKKQKSTKNIPIIMFSAHASSGLVARECGADGFISKPFDIYKLVQLVKKHLKKSP